jgi:hypothetical protein
MQQGFTKEQIRTKLLYEGWNEYLIQKSFSYLDSIKEPIKEKDTGIESILKKDTKKTVHNKMKAFET